MPPDKHNSIMAKVTGLMFSLFDVALAREVPFGIPQYIQCILHGLTSVLLYVPFILLTAKSVETEIIRIFHSGYFDCRGAFEQFLIRTTVWVEHSQQQSIMNTSLFRRYSWGTRHQPILLVCMGCRGAFRTVLDSYCCIMG